MKYIVNAITDLVVNNAPSVDGEMMIRIDGFEDKIGRASCRERV